MKATVAWEATVFGVTEITIRDDEFVQWCDENDIPEEDRLTAENIKEFLDCGNVEDWSKHVDVAFDYHNGSEDFKLEEVQSWG